MARYEEQRNFLKSDFKTFSAIETDKQKGIPQPPNVKAYDADAEIVDLPAVHGGVVKKENIYEIIKERRSVRHYAKDALTIDELSYLLWSTQAITGTNRSGITFRTVPCSGGTHSFETYLFILNVDGLKKGVYRYLADCHKLLYLSEVNDIDEQVDKMTLDQPFVPNFAKRASVIFSWSCIPYRSEWKYDITAHKKILIDIGAVMENLYLTSESIDAGTCALGIYDQDMVDELLHLDGEDEFTIFLAAVGKKVEKKERS